jgi:MSHA biogenesis protein MshM
MYLQHFGLKELPFTLTPNTHFFLNMASHHAAYNMLMVSIMNGEGFMKIVGEVGTGKTILCRKVLNTLSEDERNFETAYIPNPILSPKGLFLAFAEEIGLEASLDIDHHSLLKEITNRLVERAGQGRKVVLFIDEAHAMPEETLEALRLLTNIETEKAKLLQVILFAQPEMDVILNKITLRQLRQRITFSFDLVALDREGVDRYINHRLAMAGHNGHAIFTKKSIDLLTSVSRGIPRLVNIIAHKALMVAFGKGERRVDESHIRTAALDTDGVELPSRSTAPRIAAVLVTIIGIAAAFFFGGFRL